jgi:hypothetical protein
LYRSFDENNSVREASGTRGNPVIVDLEESKESSAETSTPTTVDAEEFETTKKREPITGDSQPKEEKKLKKSSSPSSSSLSSSSLKKSEAQKEVPKSETQRKTCFFLFDL